MRIFIEHRTCYQYAEPATYSVQSLRMTPRSFDGQRILDWRIEAVGIELACPFRDCFGNDSHVLTRRDSHDEAIVRVMGTVETSDRAGIVRGIHEAAPARVYLRQTARTKADAAIQHLAERTTEIQSISALHDLMGRVRDAIDYDPDSTDESTTAAEALALGRGVCQDHSHVFIAACRHLGVPARYVTGYLVSPALDPAPAHHAWAEAFVENLGWVGFDVTHRVCPNESYVRLACGLDAWHAAPIRGIRKGSGSEALSVDVFVGGGAQ